MKANKLIAKKIIVVGIVQGIGFRPLVYHIAQKYGVLGTVRNLGGQAEIIVEGDREAVTTFIEDLREGNNKDYEIVKMDIEDLEPFGFDSFKIIESSSNEDIAIIPPDLPVCPKCTEELFNTEDRRYKNPFISCMVCGPRYTIFEKLPYDRHNTTMVDFDMCPECLSEYTSPESRRFHAQTISCDECGPYLIYRDKINNKYNNETALEKAVDEINRGGIIAVKGIGGYHFACSPFNEEVVLNLRKLKGREEKPFAVMFPSMDSIREYCHVSKKEEELLNSKARPIVLIKTKSKEMAYSTSRGSLYCGAFLPYTPLQILLTKHCGPLIMTSGNISDKPIIREDNEMLAIKSEYLSGVLYNTRRIMRSVDDSVVRVIDEGAPQLIRRSRGYVPYPIFMPDIFGEKQVFAAGSDMKAAFCLYKKGNAVLSQYFGDLMEQSILDEYKNGFKDLSGLLKASPMVAVCDMHPNYFSTRFAASLKLETIYVQHHHAHIASVMAEHNLREGVIGVAFDGTGYGTDGCIWGGEFLICEGAEFKRAGHLEYFPFLGGDQSITDTRKTATCLLLNTGLEEYINDDRKDLIKAALKNKINTVLSSSMGRLFDGVASILGIGNENKYEGECAILLEKLATQAYWDNREPKKLAFEVNMEDDNIYIGAKTLLRDLCQFRDEADTGALALGFHYALAELILRVCRIIRDRDNIDIVALSGGVFQNTLLMNKTLSLLREENFKVYYNIAVPPNDGGISLGQTLIGLLR